MAPRLTYTYDGNLKRVKLTTADGIFYDVYSRVSGQIAYRFNAATNERLDMVSVGPLSVTIKNGVPKWFYHSDHLGNRVAATDANGAVLWREAFTPFGEQLLEEEDHNFSLYTGHVKDRDTGLTYMQARHYDPIIGRFLQTDPIGYQDQLNLYAYVHNDPVNATDPDGRQACPISACGLSLGQNARGVSHETRQMALRAEANGMIQAAGIMSVTVGAALAVNELVNGGSAPNDPSGLGDLTNEEVDQIQGVVDEAGRPLDVVGSAARGERRGVGSDAPIGKGPGTRSDTDFTTAPSNMGNFEGLEGGLPNADPGTPILNGTPETGNPSIRFEPNTPPKFIEEN